MTQTQNVPVVWIIQCIFIKNMEAVIPIKPQKINITGEITARFYDQSGLSRFERAYNALLKRLAGKDRRWLLRYYILGHLKRVDEKRNVICNIGLEAVCKRLASIDTYTCNINYCALGTGTPVTAAVGDTTLDTESYRNATASGTASANVAYITAYYTETECNGTYYEFGNFIEGTGAADSGQLWSHIAGHTWVKDATTVIVIDCKYTFASV